MTCACSSVRSFMSLLKTMRTPRPPISTIQSGYLEVACLLANVGIGERADDMRLLQRALIHVVVEDHENTQAADLDHSIGLPGGSLPPGQCRDRRTSR